MFVLFSVESRVSLVRIRNPAGVLFEPFVFLHLYASGDVLRCTAEVIKVFNIIAFV